MAAVSVDGRAPCMTASSLKQKFAQVETFSPPGLTTGLDSTQSHHAAKSLLVEPAFGALRPIAAAENGYLSFHLGTRQCHIGRRGRQVALIFRNFIFHDQMTAECIPSQLRDHTMILMQIGAMMAENE